MSPVRGITSLWIPSALALVAVVLAPGCITEPGTADNNASNVYLQVVSMESSTGGLTTAQPVSNGLFSDVCFADSTHPPCGVFNDDGVVTLRAVLKDRTSNSSAINDVTITRYRVTYVRADGRNVPGVDVPYPFDGAANFTVSSDGTAVEWSFVVVRHQAKEESPLRELAVGGSIISTIGQIDFYGNDTAGRAVMVTGYLSITFGDFANE